MLVFLKLGGSLITDKTRPYTPRLDKIKILSAEIASALQENDGIQLILGHGSGSFGHQAANQFGTRNGVSNPEAWRGFSEVWYQASTLNRFIVEAIRSAGLPGVTLAPFPAVIANDGNVICWDLTPIKFGLEKGLLPIIHGDVVFDTTRGGTILSTEDLFSYLAPHLNPNRILLAGLEDGIWADFPTRHHLLKEMTPESYKVLASGMGQSLATDVTGGMDSKVAGMLSLLPRIPKLEVLIFSGGVPGNVHRALMGENPGTLLHC